MVKLLFYYLLFAALLSCGEGQSQLQNKPVSNKKVGGPCEGCEVIYASPVPFDKLDWVDTLPDFTEPGPKMVISGIIYKADGKTPAKDVVLYVYHTDQTGRYANRYNEKSYAGRHGYIKGWIRTNAKGAYKFYTLKPAPYPGTTMAAHIHPVIKEPTTNEYYIDEYLFDDDPFLTVTERSKQEGRGGSGIITLAEKDGIFYGERNIYLGRNIPDYPSAKIVTMESGLAIGDDCPAFDPIHLSGADINKRACPMCKYGYGQGVMVWFNHTSLDKLKRFARLMEDEMLVRGENRLRVFLIYMNPGYADNDAKGQLILRDKIKKWCEEQSLLKVAMLWVPSPIDKETSGVFQLNPQAANTIFVYKKRRVTAKWVNADYSDETVKNILGTL